MQSIPNSVEKLDQNPTLTIQPAQSSTSSSSLEADCQQPIIISLKSSSLALSPQKDSNF